MTDTNNTDGAALLPVTQAARDAAADFHHVNGFGPMQSRRMTADEMRSGRHDRDPLVKAFARFERDILARAPLPATQEDAERSGVDVDTVAKIIDPDAWHETLPTDGCGVYWIERRNKARSQAKAIAALQPEKADPSNHDQNKAGGLWYRRWFKAQARVNELETALSTPAMSDRQEYDGEAVREALEPFACDDFETPITDEQGWTDFGLSWSKDRIRDWFGPSEFRRAREVYRAALAHPAQATPSALSGDAGEGINRVTSSISFGNLRDLVGMRRELRPGTFAYAALIDLIDALPSHKGAE